MIYELDHPYRVTFSIVEKKRPDKRNPGKTVFIGYYLQAYDPLRLPKKVQRALKAKKKRDAYGELEVIERLVRAGDLDLWEQGGRLPGGRPMSCREACEEYLAEILTCPSVSGLPIRSRTHGQYAYVIRNFAGWMEGALHVSAHLRDIREQHVSGFVFGRGLGQGTMSTQLNRVRAFLDWCVKRRYIRMNPAAELKAPRSHVRKVPLVMAQYEALLAYIEGYNRAVPAVRRRPEHKLRSLRYAVMLGMESGLRCGELCHLQWNDVDLSTPGDECIHVVDRVAHRTKNGRSRRVEIAGRLVKSLKELRAASPSQAVYVLHEPDGHPVRENYLSKTFTEFVRFADLSPGLTFHSTRHGYASRLAQQGTPIAEICRLLGHSSLSMTERYVHELAGGAREHVDRAFGWAA